MMDRSGWDFDAPTFVDFGKDEHIKRDDGVDSYFSYDHESLKSTDMTEEDLPNRFHSSQFSDVQTNNSRLTFDTPKKINPTLPTIAPTGSAVLLEKENHQSTEMSSPNDIIKPIAIDNIGQIAVAPCEQAESPIDSVDGVVKSEITAGDETKAASTDVSIPSADSLGEMMEYKDDAPVHQTQTEFQINTLNNDSQTNAVGDCHETESDVANPPVTSSDEVMESEAENDVCQTEMEVKVKIQNKDEAEKPYVTENDHKSAAIHQTQTEFQINTLNNDSLANATAVGDCHETESDVANPPVTSPDEVMESETEKSVCQTGTQMEVKAEIQNKDEAEEPYVLENDHKFASSPVIQVSRVSKDVENQNASGTAQHLGEIRMDVETESAEHDEKVQEREESGRQMPSNLITPSRLAVWEQSRKRRSVMSKQLQRRSGRLQKCKERNRLRETGGIKTQTDQPPDKKMKRNVQLVIPRTPTVLKHQRNPAGAWAKTREQREIEEIEKLKYEQRERMKVSSKSFKAAIKGQAPRPTTVNKTTKVKEFHFKTDERIKSHSMETRSQNSSSDVDFVKGLRQHPPSPKKLTRTVVKPFKLSDSRKRKLEVEPQNSYEFKPMAKAVMDFQRGTRSLKAPETSKGPMKAKPSLTVAKTPKLQSRSRRREPSVIGADKMEDLEVEEMRNYHFKARPANQRILSQPATLPEVEKMPSTEPKGFVLHIDKRVQERPEHERTPSPTRAFRARPVSKAVIEGNMHIVKADRSKLTVAQSPAFKLKSRMAFAQKIRENIEKEIQKPVQKVKPKFLAPEIPKPRKLADVPESRNVEVQPFSFHDKDQERFAKKEEKIREIHEAEKAAASAFRATPVSEDDPSKCLPPKHVRHPTIFQPFHLHTDERGTSKSGQWKKDVEEELKVLREKAEFKANNTYKRVLHSEGWKPKVEKKCTETFEEFPLHSNVRAVKRQEFDEHIKENESRSMAMLEEKKQQQEIREQAEVEEMRRLAEFEAAPIRKYKEILIKESERLPTQPQSPNFSDRFYKKNPVSDDKN